MPVTHQAVACQRLDTSAGEGTSRVQPAGAVQLEGVRGDIFTSLPSTIFTSGGPRINRTSSSTSPPTIPINHEFRSAVYMLAQLIATQSQLAVMDVVRPSERP